MKNKKDNRNSIDNLEYEIVLKEEIFNSYESNFQKDTELDKKKIKFYMLKRTSLEIVNRSFFFFFIGSFLFSLVLAYSESKSWFILYVMSALSCVFYTPNRKALKELIAAWPNIEDLIKGRSLWRNSSKYMMKPLSSFKKWLLNILVPYIEGNNKKKG
tara:strand:+ start:237 stop:710 length:474 start_codon:yes stop_codon:yes gene_type:complete